MKTVSVLLGCFLLLCSFESKSASATGPVGGNPGERVQVIFSGNCPISTKDVRGTDNSVVACELNGKVISGAACRKQGQTVTWQGVGNTSFAIVFADSNAITPGSCKSGSNNQYECTLASTGLNTGDKLKYEVTAAGCPALDPYIIVF